MARNEGADEGSGERARLTSAFATAQRGLERELEGRTVELARTGSALADELKARERAEVTIARLERRLAAAREHEQRRLARDLHDQTGQHLTALSLAIANAKRQNSTEHGESCDAAWADLEGTAAELAAGLRELTTRLHPSALDELGLEPALEQVIETWSARSRIHVEFQYSARGLRPTAEVATAIYRIVQEALTNVARHARAGQVTITVDLDDWEATVTVNDDGRGFDAAQSLRTGRHGIRGIRERLTPFRGTLQLESAPGMGTRLTARLPLGAPSRDA